MKKKRKIKYEEIEELKSDTTELLEETIDLNTVREIYQKWFFLKNTYRIDIIHALALTRKMKGKPVWVILVGSSGDGKS